MNIKKYLSRFKKSIWLFPAICLVILLILASFKISGTSAGEYWSYFYGNKKDSNLIVGKPRPIRSDEWEWELNMQAAQKAANFPNINKNIGDGQNMEIIVDAPFKNWTVIFKPQVLVYFILPFAVAYAFKWWLLGFLLVVGCYLFVLLLLPRKRLLAAGISICLFFSPFIQWWYQSITLAPIFYTFLIIFVLYKLWKSKDNRIAILWIVLLSYFLVAFSILLYPPFQIPCALVGAAFILGFFLEKGFFQNRKILVRGLVLTATSLLIFLFLIFGFYSVNKTAIHATENSIYPGKRVGTSGNFDAEVFFANFLDSQLQITHKANSYVANQSEASDFILLAPFLIFPVVYLLIKEWHKRKQKDWPLVFISAIFLIFMVRLFVPGTNFLFTPLFLGSVPNNRLIIGVGLSSFFMLILFIRHVYLYKSKFSNIFVYASVAVVWLFNILIAMLTRKAHPGYIHSIPLILVLSLFPALIVGLLLKARFYYAIGILLVFSIISAGIVNPLYRGTGPLVGSTLTSDINSIGQKNPNAKWAVVDNLTLENVPSMSNVRSITNTYAYPQTGLWSANPQVAKQYLVYDRFAHTLVVFQPTSVRLLLEQADYFEIVGSPCSTFYKDEGVKFFLAQTNYSQEYSCLSMVQEIKYPNIDLYILEINN